MDTGGRNRWHTTEPWHNSPLPEGVSHAVTVPPGRGGGRSGGPSEQTWTGTQDGDLQSGTDNGGHGGAGSSGSHGGAGSSGGHGRWTSGPWPRSPRPGPYSRNPFYPPKKISLGKSGGIRSPPGLDTQNSTWQDSRARQTGQDIPQEPEALLGWLGSWGFLWAWRRVRGPHRVPQQPLPFPRQGGRRLEWPPWPQQEEPPVPDESPWTRQDMVL